ncbi:hypothetical protein RHIZ_03760 [Rhizobium skierniewicense]|uniref:hypothetical protein n=1 Tax=Rhizobium skierniewicense TaxID=984260 RepID=UPI001FAD738C|nr:hypothetical protein [Rhizobium skierniewicense]MCI9865057.1 hypothetical protein [Rhizobium skierniewicense]
MTLDAILSNLIDQEKGQRLELVEPWEGTPIGVRLLIAGPDSQTQHKARIGMMDELSNAADSDGKVSFEAREKARLACLARCVQNWDVAADFGLDARFGHAAMLKLLAVAWIEQQTDAFAGDRSKFRSVE